MIEGVGVVPMAGTRREHRGEVDEVDAERLEVVEVLGHALEVAAVELVHRLAPVGEHRCVPVGLDRPVRGRPIRLLRRARRTACEAVGEDLVAHRIGEPRRRSGERDEPEVVTVGDVALERAGPVDPPDPVGGLHQEPVGDVVAGHRQVHLPPRHAGIVPIVQPSRRTVAGLAVVDGAHVHGGGTDGVGHPQTQADRVTDGRGDAVEVVRGPVVVGLCGEVHSRPTLPATADRPAVRPHPLTAPAVMPPTMKRCRNWNSSTTGIAAISAPTANGPQLRS